jgi:hypothetical protein
MSLHQMKTVASFIVFALLHYFQVTSAFTHSLSPLTFKFSVKSTTHQNMAKMSGLEIREEGATPLRKSYLTIQILND